MSWPSRLMFVAPQQVLPCRPFSEYGTVLRINSAEHTPDGRSLLATVGERRFRVVERGMVNGYHTAKIQFLMDEPVTGEQDIGEHCQNYNGFLVTSCFHGYSFPEGTSARGVQSRQGLAERPATSHQSKSPLI